MSSSEANRTRQAAGWHVQAKLGRGRNTANLRRLTVARPWAGIAFLGVSGAALLVCLTELLSVRANTRSFAGPDNAFRCLMAAELFFFVFIWPQFAFGRGPGRDVLLLAVLSLPLLLTAVAVADAPVLAVLRGHALLVCVAAAVAECARRDSSWARWYYLVAACACAVMPLMRYMVYDLLDVKLAWLVHCSPFEAMDRAVIAGAQWPLPTMIALAALTAALHWKKTGASGPPAGAGTFKQSLDV